MSITQVISDVLAERVVQDKTWGPVHDDAHTEAEWVALLVRHLGLGVDDGKVGSNRFRKQMIRVAALAVAAVESYGRLHPPVKVAPGRTYGAGH